MLMLSSVTNVLAEYGYTISLRLPALSCQPELVFVYMPGAHVVELEISATITFSTNTSLLTPPIQSVEKSYRIRMVPIPWAPNWFVTQIPGLPAKTWIFSVRLPARTISVAFNVASSVEYKLIVDGAVISSGGYNVLEYGFREKLPPLVYSFVYEALNDTSILSETLGLAPHGWVLGEDKPLKIMIVAFDDSSTPEVGFEYRIGEGTWTSAPVNASTLMDDLKRFINDISNAIKVVEDWVKQYAPDVELPRPVQGIRLAEAVIPPQPAGSYVMFRTSARDADGNTMYSPMGLYYSVKEASDTRILILDPHVMLWLLQENLRELNNTLRLSTSYEVPNSELSNKLNISMSIATYGLVQFHHWEYLGKYYNLYIAWPGRDVVNILESFKPNVIILSNLVLGVRGNDLWDWDLRDITADGRSLLEHIASYVKQNHVGVIATHGTLSDEIAWLSCESRVKIGARGHVGYNLSDVDIVNERTVAALLGMPELALWEYVRDKVAEALCASAKYQPVLEAIAIAVGSTPLQVPHVPWDGRLRLTPEAKDLGWGLPDEFEVVMPTLLSRYGFKAYTEVGWQLALPKAVAYTAWDTASRARANISVLVDRLANLYENISGRAVKASELGMHFNRAVDHGLSSFYGGLSKAVVRGSRLNISVTVPELGKVVNISIDIGREALLKLLQRLPVKIVALSPNGLAGIVAYDKFWDPQGYRAVYISFEVESAEGEVAEKILVNAVEWVKKWQYMNATELLGNIVRVPKDVASRFRDLVARAPGERIFEDGVLLNEEGGTEIELNATQSRLHLVVAHPTTDAISIGIAKGFAKAVNITASNRVTYAVIEVEKPGTIVLLLRAGSDSSLNPAYVSIKQEALAPAPATVTTTVTTTYTTTNTVTIPTTTTLTQIITTTIPTTLTTTTRIYETITETIVKHETITTTSIATVTTEKTVEKTATLTVTTPTTVYEKVVDWGTTIPIAKILLVIGIAIGYLIKRK